MGQGAHRAEVGFPGGRRRGRPPLHGLGHVVGGPGPRPGPPRLPPEEGQAARAEGLERLDEKAPARPAPAKRPEASASAAASSAQSTLLGARSISDVMCRASMCLSSKPTARIEAHSLNGPRGGLVVAGVGEVGRGGADQGATLRAGAREAQAVSAISSSSTLPTSDRTRSSPFRQESIVSTLKILLAMMAAACSRSAPGSSQSLPRPVRTFCRPNAIGLLNTNTPNASTTVLMKTFELTPTKYSWQMW
ncbi:unnamed protein product [Prorocentrum cordatum]|uniref:Uncharacterized protein n=1 Tax=Prorocentrum cordatum TaxID=2364126 RepID=A0ABN9RUL3_9DINO|nr:unnamed protein product [Polarella glacialis]